MLMEGKITLQGAPVEEVWDFLLNPETLIACVPGAEKMEAIDEETYESIISQKVGPVHARFEFTTTLAEVDRPRYVKAVGRGADIGKSRGGTFSQETTVSLSEVSKDCVEISYRSHVNIVGRLATSGDRIMRAKARQVEKELTRNLQERLNSQVASGG